MTTFTQDEIIEMAKEAGLSNPLWIENDYEIIETFAHLVAAKEREACAKLCEELRYTGFGYEIAPRQAAAIRARGEQA